MMLYKFSDIVPSMNCIAKFHNLMFLAWNDTILFYCFMHLAKHGKHYFSHLTETI